MARCSRAFNRLVKKYGLNFVVVRVSDEGYADPCQCHSDRSPDGLLVTDNWTPNPLGTDDWNFNPLGTDWMSKPPRGTTVSNLVIDIRGHIAAVVDLDAVRSKLQDFGVTLGVNLELVRLAYRKMYIVSHVLTGVTKSELYRYEGSVEDRRVTFTSFSPITETYRGLSNVTITYKCGSPAEDPG